VPTDGIDSFTIALDAQCGSLLKGGATQLTLLPILQVDLIAAQGSSFPYFSKGCNT
jgi:hypothetical protein